MSIISFFLPLVVTFIGIWPRSEFNFEANNGRKEPIETLVGTVSFRVLL